MTEWIETRELVLDAKPPKPADMVAVVRCRDCKHYSDYENSFEPNLGYCREHDRHEVRDSWYCAWGERRGA